MNSPMHAPMLATLDEMFTKLAERKPGWYEVLHAFRENSFDFTPDRFAEILEEMVWEYVKHAQTYRLDYKEIQRLGEKLVEELNRVAAG